jgi:PBP1b-binding outer membrane lipoprotein LpoB
MKKIIPLLFLTLFLGACSMPSSLKYIPTANVQEVGAPDFQYKPSMVCSVAISTNQAEIGTPISFTGLDTQNPKVLYQANTPIDLEKVYDNNGRIILQTVAGGNPNVDTFLINKETGVFSKSSMGDFWGIYIVADKGTCLGQ